MATGPESSTYSYRPEYNIRQILWSQSKISEAARLAWGKIDEVLADLETLSEGCVSFHQLFLRIRPSLQELQVSLAHIASLSWMITQ
jgi:hypothetical protein